MWIGVRGARTEIVMLATPDGGTTVELSRFIHPSSQPGNPAAMATELGLRNIAFEVDDLHQVAAGGYGLLGGIGTWENSWMMAYVRGPEGIIAPLAQRVSAPQRQ